MTNSNRFFDPTVETDEYKLNNYQAFRAMFDIIKNRGKLPLDQTLYKYVTEGFPANAPNAKVLAEKLRRFSAAWQAAPQDRKEDVEKIVRGAFFDGFWLKDENVNHYADAMRLYRINGSTNVHFPTYFNVDKYLDAILGTGTTLKKLPDADNRDYYQLAEDWAKALRQNEIEYYGENT